jgi:hypothetical protein
MQRLDYALYLTKKKNVEKHTDCIMYNIHQLRFCDTQSEILCINVSGIRTGRSQIRNCRYSNR